MYKGRHLLIDCHNVSRDVCLNDQLILESMARAATRAGATVISQVRYHFGHNSPPGFTAMCLLDESHCSAHCYADLGLIALDIFTCGRTDPNDILKYIREEVDLGEVNTVQMPRFTLPVTLPQDVLAAESVIEESCEFLPFEDDAEPLEPVGE